jgi:hypothetical protein
MSTIMRNAFITRVKIANREAPGAVECIAPTIAVEASKEWSSAVREVQAAIDRLPAYYRRAVLLIGVSGVSYDQTARICGCNIGTVKSRLNRARMQILEQFGARADPIARRRHKGERPMAARGERNAAALVADEAQFPNRRISPRRRLFFSRDAPPVMRTTAPRARRRSPALGCRLAFPVFRNAHLGRPVCRSARATTAGTKLPLRS